MPFAIKDVGAEDPFDGIRIPGEQALPPGGAGDSFTGNRISPDALAGKLSGLKILVVFLEFRTWANARYWSYPAGLGWEEGLRANGIEFLTIPAIFETPSSATDSWLRHAREICGGRRFDQVWLTVNHVKLDDGFLSWLSGMAPVRLGFVVESLEMTTEEWKRSPQACRDRQEKVERVLPYLTHVAVVDEKDTSDPCLGTLPAVWWPPSVPGRSIRGYGEAPRREQALFYGALYGERKAWLVHPDLRDLLVRPEASPEHSTQLPALFDRLNVTAESVLSGGHAVNESILSSYIEKLRLIRRASFSLWLEGLREGCAVVNLAQYGKLYSGRVFEGMAAGRPVIACEIPDRPLTKALFENGKEILLFHENQPSHLAEHIRRLVATPGLGRRIEESARKKLERYHTTETRTAQILAWLETGDRPSYG